MFVALFLSQLLHALQTRMAAAEPNNTTDSGSMTTECPYTSSSCSWDTVYNSLKEDCYSVCDKEVVLPVLTGLIVLLVIFLVMIVSLFCLASKLKSSRLKLQKLTQGVGQHEENGKIEAPQEFELQVREPEVQQLHPYEDIIDPVDSKNKVKVAIQPPSAPHMMPEKDNGNNTMPGKIPQYTEVVKMKKDPSAQKEDYNKLKRTPEPTLPTPTSQLANPQKTDFQETYSALDCPSKDQRGGPHYELCTGDVPPAALVMDGNFQDPTPEADKIVYYNETAVKRAGK